MSSCYCINQIDIKTIYSFLLYSNQLFQEHLKDRIFTIFDQNEDGCLSVDEYMESLRRFTNKDNPDESIRFLFKIFDIDGMFSN